MTFENRVPAQADYCDHLTVYEITGSERWNPQRFDDDSNAILLLSDSIIKDFAASAKPDAVSFQDQHESDQNDIFHMTPYRKTTITSGTCQSHFPPRS